MSIDLIHFSDVARKEFLLIRWNCWFQTIWATIAYYLPQKSRRYGVAKYKLEISLFKVYTLRCLLRCQSTVQAVRTVTQADDFTYRWLPTDWSRAWEGTCISFVYVGRRERGKREKGSRALRESGLRFQTAITWKRYQYGTLLWT